MNLNDRIQKLRQRRQLLRESLKQAEVQASKRARTRQTRAKIILGAAVLSTPAKQREALLGMILDQIVERDRQFVSEYLAGDQPLDVPPGSDAQGEELRREPANIVSTAARR